MHLDPCHRIGYAFGAAVLAMSMLSSLALAGSGPSPRAPSRDQRLLPTHAAADSVLITSSRWWTFFWQGDPKLRLRIVGDVLNDTDSRNDPTIQARLYNAANVLLATWQVEAVVEEIAARTHSTFVFEDYAPTGFDHLTLTAVPAETPVPMDGPLLVIPGGSFTDSQGRHYPATLKNVSSVVLYVVDASVALYDANRQIINVVAQSVLPSGSTLAPGASVTYDLIFEDHYAGTTRSVHQALGFGVNGVRRTTTWDNYFDDTFDSQFSADIIWLAEHSITGGCDIALFCPTDDVTRGQMAAFLDRALHLPPTSTDFFTDDDDSIYEPSINRLAAAGITAGCTATEFCPTDFVTRGQMAAFLDRGFHLPPTGTDFFTDDDSSIFEPNINRLAEAGITGGCTATTFCPTANVTRGQMAAFLHRALI